MWVYILTTCINKITYTKKTWGVHTPRFAIYTKFIVFS